MVDPTRREQLPRCAIQVATRVYVLCLVVVFTRVHGVAKCVGNLRVGVLVNLETVKYGHVKVVNYLS